MRLNIFYKFVRRIQLFLEKGNDLYQKQFCLTGERTQFYQTAKVDNMSSIRDNICVGRNTHIRGELFVYPYCGRIVIGDDCYIGEGARIWSEKSVQVGDRVLISHNVDIHDCNDHPVEKRARHKHFLSIIKEGFTKDFDLNGQEICIKDDVWIGFAACIMKGVTIGEGAVIAAHTVVTADIPPGVVVGGNPARILKTISNEQPLE